MAEDNDFADFLLRIRAGDAVAAEELVRRYEPLIRRKVRLPSTTPAWAGWWVPTTSVSRCWRASSSGRPPASMTSASRRNCWRS